jgi:hypothetical protein
MANKYTKADNETRAEIDGVIKEHHEELSAIGVEFDVLFGYAPTNDEGEITGSALKVHGYPVNSVSRIVNLRDRVKGNADAEIILDGDAWPKLEPEQKTAVIDRAISQFVIARNIDGEVILDTHGRPKLKLRQADWHIEIYNDIASRHGANSPEITQLMGLAKSGQIDFGFMKQLKPKKE